MKNKKYNQGYVVGFHGKKQCVYGLNWDGKSWIARMTLGQAKKRVLELNRGKIKRVIYQLVPISFY